MSTPEKGGDAAGLPDVAALTQLANHFFRALPGALPAGIPQGTSLPGGASEGLPAVVPQGIPRPGGLPPTSSAGFPTSPTGGYATLSSVPTGIPASPPTTLPVTAVGGIPAGVPAGTPSSLPPGFPVGAPPGFPSSVPGGFPAGVSAGFPSSFPGGIPSSAPAGFPAGFPGSGSAGVPASEPRAGFDTSALKSGGPRPASSTTPSPTFPFVPPSAAPPISAVPGGAPVPSAAPGFYFLEHVRSFPSPTPAVGAWDEPQQIGARGGQFDVEAVRRDFPILSEQVNGHPLVWLDNAATTQKPQSVIDRIAYFYAHENSNIHRAAHTLAARSTDAYEAARDKVRRFLNAGSSREIIFARGATEAINLVAQSYGRRYIGEGDEIVISWLEHHSNIVPWQLLATEVGARLRVAPVDDDGQILLDEYEKLLNPRTRIVSLTQVSNALGTVTPVREMVAMAHRHGAKVLVDGAQAVSHLRVDVQALDADFYAFSGHKVFGPTGIGVLYGKSDLLEAMPPWQGGGNMITDVTFEKSSFHPAPMRFEAGTGNIADAVGLGAAIDYLDQVGMENVTRHEHDLLVYGTNELLRVPGLRLIGTAREKAGVLSFVVDGFRSEDIGAALASQGIAVRSGHHCAQPALRRFGLETSVRPSLALYNNCEDIDALIAVLLQLTSSKGRTFV